jgi:putative SOS response-associated peptidase YedK
MDISDSRAHNYPPRWNAAPSQDLLVIRRNHETDVVSLDALHWGLIPHWCQDPTGGRKPINAKCETVYKLPMFKDAIIGGAAFSRRMASTSGRRSRARRRSSRMPLP